MTNCDDFSITIVSSHDVTNLIFNFAKFGPFRHNPSQRNVTACYVTFRHRHFCDVTIRDQSSCNAKIKIDITPLYNHRDDKPTQF